MPYQKKYATEEERRRAKAEGAKKAVLARIKNGNNNKGGRPKGSRNKNPSAAIPSKTMTVRENDYKVYVKLAYAANVPIVEFMHIVAESLKAKNPDIFKREDQAVNM